MGLFSRLFSRKPDKYSNEWISSLSDDEWEKEREEVRLRLCDDNFDAMSVLGRFDDEWRKRNDDGKPWTPPAHREHGWYLPNDDD